MKPVKMIIPFDFEMVKKYETELNDLSMGLSIEEIIEETVKRKCMRLDLREWLDYVNDCVFYEHVSNDMVVTCKNYLERVMSLIADLTNTYVSKMSVFSTVSDISFDYLDNSIIVEGTINDGGS